MRYSAIILSALLLTSCFNLEEKKEEEPSISERLPISDRDMLLEPMEWAMDDLVRSIDEDQVLQYNFSDFKKDGVQYRAAVKTEGKDTFYIEGTINGNGVTEKHCWYFDKKGAKVFSSHTKKDGAYDALGNASEEGIKFYFEESGAVLSVYRKLAIGSNSEAENEWEPYCPTSAFEAHLQQRKQLIVANMKAEK